MEAFLYCWTDIKTKKIYLGYHKGTIDDGYVCSSKSMIKEYDIRPNDFSRQIIAVGSSNDMRNLETKILRAENAPKNPSYYNLNVGDGSFVCLGHSEETKKKFSMKRKGKLHTEETKKKISEGNKKRKPISEETRIKMSESAKKRANSLEGKNKLQEIAHLGMKKRVEMNTSKLNPEQKKNISDAIKKKWSDGEYNNRKSRSDKGVKRT
jgi:hypothetical protein